MSSVSRGGLGLVVGVTFTAVACSLWPTFPDDLLHPDTSLDGGLSDAGWDGGTTDTGSNIPDVPGTPDAGMDGGGTDASTDGGTDTGPTVDAGPGCGMVPTAGGLASRTVIGAVPTATDFAFDGHGSVAVAFGTEVDLIAPGGTRSTFVTGLPGTVVTLRYAPTGDLVMALVTSLDGGMPVGVIGSVSSGGTGFRVLASGVNSPGALAVDATGHVWYADGMNGTVTRFLLGPVVGRPAVIFSDVPNPTGLAFDGPGTGLYVSSAIPGQMATVYKVTLMPGDGDTVTVLPATPYAGGLTANGPLTGMALDQCGYLYATDPGRNLVWRVDPPSVGSTFLHLVMDIPGPTGLAFGQGGPFDGRTLFSLDNTGALHAVGVTALGVSLPTPP